MEEIKLDDYQPFDLESTLCCGQTFRWSKIGEWWYGTVGESVFKIRQAYGKLEFENASRKMVEEYFGLKDDLQEILRQIAKDQHMQKVVRTVKGLRILRQNPWECLISYICATYKNIPAISRMLHCLCKKFGDKVFFDGYAFYTFPEAESLAKAGLADLAECGLGYRAKYVLEAAKKVYSGELNVENLRVKGFEEARKELVSLKGVGLKAADCVLLFSLEKLEAFPVDVWVKRALIRHYASHFDGNFLRRIVSKSSLTIREYELLSSFGRNYFGKFAGYAQEYLYHFERQNFKSNPLP